MTWITVVNGASVPALVGPTYLFPGESRLVPLSLFELARRQSPSLYSPDAPAQDAPSPATVGVPERTVGAPTPAEEPVDDLAGLKKAELVERVAALGIEPGRATKQELIDLLLSTGVML